MTMFAVDTVPVDQLGPVEIEQSIPSDIPNPLDFSQDLDYSIKDTIKGWIDQVVQGSTRSATLVNFCILIMAVSFFKSVFYYIQGFFMVWVQQSVMRNFRDRLFSKYQRLSLAYFHSRRTGQIISRVTNDVQVLNDSIDIGFNRLVTDSVMVLVLSLSLIVLSWELTLLAAFILPAVFGFIWFVGRKMRKYSERAQQRMADVNSVIEEAVNNVRIVKAFSMEDFESKRFFRTTREFFRSLVRMHRIRHLASPINDILATLAGTVILYFAGTKIVEGTGNLDGGDFITFIGIMLTLIKPVKSLSQIHIKIQEGMAAAARVFEVLDAEETVPERVGARESGEFTKSIRYEAVSFAYDEREPVLRDISFEVGAGEVVAVVGPSGAGKSTLLDLLPRFYDPQSGRVLVDGHDVRDLTLKSLRDQMGIVTQETYLFNDTVANNIAYGLGELPPEDIEAASRMANAHDFISEFEDGYNTMVGNRGVRLSGGQRQRLAIARALLRNPRILIFDEATSALDTESETLVQEAIDRLMSNRTALVIAHRLSTIKTANRILVLDQGRITEAGTHAELMALKGLYSRLYEMQFRDWQ